MSVHLEIAKCTSHAKTELSGFPPTAHDDLIVTGEDSPPPSYSSNKSDTTDVQQQVPHRLLSRTQRLVKPRDFYAEVRGQMDVEHLLDSCSVLLDVEETGLEEIVTLMAEERSGNHPYIPCSRIKEKLFMPIQCGKEFVRCSNSLSIREHLQGIVVDEQEGIIEDQSWLALSCPMEDIVRPRLCFARLNGPTNFGPGLGDVRFVLLVIAPLQQKETKSAAEIARTFGTLLADAALRNEFVNAESQAEFVGTLRQRSRQLTEQSRKAHEATRDGTDSDEPAERWFPGRGLRQDVQRRLPHYKSDYLDGIGDCRALQKTISSAVFLYFIVLPTAIALGMLNEENTHRRITVKKAILGQWIGGLLFGMFGGQLFLVVLTSPPISIYVKVIERISHMVGYEFFQLYSAIGVWCCVYLVLFALFEVSAVMRYAKRSLEELFSMFIASTLTIEAIKAAVRMLGRAFMPHCAEMPIDSWLQMRAVPSPPSPHPLHPPPPPPPPHLDPLNCDRSVGLLFILLMLGTAWAALTLANFRTTPFLSKRKREIVSDYALPLAVLLMTLVANFWFGDVPKETFNLDPHTRDMVLAPFWQLPLKGQFICCVLGFPLAILMIMDQMIVTDTVDNSQNNLKKGPAANWDFLVVALINVPLSLFGLPWMHAALPQSFLHLKAQADVEDRLVDGVVQQTIVKNRESRLATLLAHAMMVPTYFFALHILRRFPTSVFNGVFLFLAASATAGNQLFQRVVLFFTEQRSYPPTHYIRRVPQRIVHLFTGVEFLQLALLIAIGHFPWPVIRLLFPIALIVFIPLRALLFPLLFKKEHLEVLDGAH